MGLDTVELVMEVEETFDIKIDDRDAEKIVTVGGLFEYVLSQLAGKGTMTGGCKSAAAFYRLRRALGESLGIARERVRPSTPVDELVPRDVRRSRWPELERALDLTLPGLAYPGWVLMILWWLFLAAAACFVALLLGGNSPGFPTPIVLSSFGSCVFAMAVVPAVARPLAVRLPSGCESIGGLAKVLVLTNYGRIKVDEGSANRGEVWETLVQLICEQLGVSADQLTAETSFVDDLGVG